MIIPDTGADTGATWNTFRQDTLQAWEAYRSTGLHVTAGEADAWLAQLAQGDDTELPACHV